MKNARRGSALLTALWLIAVLSVMAMSFAYEARQQAGINVYVRERNRVNRLTDVGQIIAEVVLTGFSEATEWSDGEDEEELFENDRWFKQKRELKKNSKCTIGPILLDDGNLDTDKDFDVESAPTVKIEIETVNGGKDGGININQLYDGGDSNWRLRWEMILKSHGIPEEFKVDVEKEGSVYLSDLLIACWNDWRDENDNVTAIDGRELGAENAWYEQYEEDHSPEIEDEDRKRPRNGSIPNVQELAYIRGFRDFPAILTGGLVYPDEKEDPDENPRLSGITGLFGTTGSAKVNVNACTVEQLNTVPGIFNEDDDDFGSGGVDVAQAIVDCLTICPRDDDSVNENDSFWPYKDWSDLCKRVDDEFDAEIGQEAEEYLAYQPDESTVFQLTITGSSMGMEHSVRAKCYVKEKKVRYIEWRED